MLTNLFLNMHYVFFVATIGDLVGTVWYAPLHLLCKPLLMLSLMLFFWQAIGQRLSPLARWVLPALFFSWAGDIFLMFDGKGFFIGGLGSFLVAHLLYLGAYRENLPTHLQTVSKSLLARMPYLLVPFLAYLCGFYAFLYPYLGELAIPVAVYAFVLMCMGVFALNRYGFTTKASFQWILAGAFLFMVSDSILATNLFVWNKELPLGNLGVMLTYISAQYAIVRGAILHIKAS